MSERITTRFRLRLIASLLAAVAIFAVGYVFYLVAPAPERAIANLTANPGGVLFMAAALFVVFGLPLWAVLFRILSWVGPLRSSGVVSGGPSVTRGPGPA